MQCLEQKGGPDGPPSLLCLAGVAVSWASSRSQSGRASADLRTTNRPDARLGGSLANNKQKRAKQPGLVPVTEATKRISGASCVHVGSFGNRDADIDRR